MNGLAGSAVQAGARFLRWWGAELRSCGEDAIALLAPKWRRPLSLHVDARRLLICDGPATSDAALVTIAREGWGAPWPQTLPPPVPAALERGRRVRILIAIECAFTRRLQLPLAALPHFKSAVALQLPKLLPMDPELLLTDVEILAVYPDSKRLDVELAAVKRADLEPLIAAIQAWGLRVGSVHLAGAPGTAARFRFRAHHDHGLPLGLRRIDRWLMATAAGLTLSCVALAATESYRAAASLGQAQAATQAAARGALGQRQVLLARLEPLHALAQHENTPTAVAVLADVSALLPTDSWITLFEVKQRNLRLVGVSPDAASVVKLLAASRLLTDVELRSSTTAGIGTGKDRFEITAAIEPAIPVTPP